MSQPPTARAPAAPRLPTPRQANDDGLVVPLGGTAPSNGVRLELEGVDRDRYADAEFFFAKGDAPAQSVKRGGFSATLSNLAPGRYHWSAALTGRGDTPPTVIEAPRGDSRNADFVIAPQVFAIRQLKQKQLDGKEMPRGRSTENGARLGVELQADYPGAVLEVEVKPAGSAFDGSGLLRAPVSDGKASLLSRATMANIAGVRGLRRQGTTVRRGGDSRSWPSPISSSITNSCPTAPNAHGQAPQDSARGRQARPLYTVPAPAALAAATPTRCPPNSRHSPPSGRWPLCVF